MYIAEFTANAVQTIPPGGSAIFTANTIGQCNPYIRHRDETGNFLLAGGPSRRRCCCKGPATADYFVDFKANIAIPTGGTVGEVSVALALDGTALPATEMVQTPAAVEEFANVSCASSVSVWGGCCESLTVQNTSDQAIEMRNAILVIEPPLANRF